MVPPNFIMKLRDPPGHSYILTPLPLNQLIDTFILLPCHICIVHKIFHWVRNLIIRNLRYLIHCYAIGKAVHSIISHIQTNRNFLKRFLQHFQQKLNISSAVIISKPEGTPLGYIGLTFAVLQKTLFISLFTLKLKKLSLCNPGV